MPKACSRSPTSRLTDPISGKTAGRYDACTKTNTCPLAMEIYSANEYWVKAASLFHTDPMGKMDLPDHPMARLYFISSHQHGTGNATSKGACQQFGNPLDSAPVQRALWDALDQWSTKGIAPPPSMVPRLADGTLVPPLPQSGDGLPEHPGRHLHGPEIDALPVELRRRLLQDGHHDDQPAGRSRRRCSTTRRTDRSIRPMSRRPMPTATTSPASGCRT